MVLPTTNIGSIAQVIQLSVAPVFLLAGVGATLNVLVGRLVRIVERARLTETQIKANADQSPEELIERLEILATRARLISRAITLSVLCAVLVPIVVVSLFLSVLLGANLELPIAIAFISAMLSLAIGLLYFLREIFVATSALSFRLSNAGQTEAQRLSRVLKNS
jgi:hypothetical protein